MGDNCMYIVKSEAAFGKVRISGSMVVSPDQTLDDTFRSMEKMLIRDANRGSVLPGMVTLSLRVPFDGSVMQWDRRYRVLKIGGRAEVYQHEGRGGRE